MVLDCSLMYHARMEQCLRQRCEWSIPLQSALDCLSITTKSLPLSLPSMCRSQISFTRFPNCRWMTSQASCLGTGFNFPLLNSRYIKTLENLCGFSLRRSETGRDMRAYRFHMQSRCGREKLCVTLKSASKARRRGKCNSLYYRSPRAVISRSRSTWAHGRYALHVSL